MTNKQPPKEGEEKIRIEKEDENLIKELEKETEDEHEICVSGGDYRKITLSLMKCKLEKAQILKENPLGGLNNEQRLWLLPAILAYEANLDSTSIGREILRKLRRQLRELSKRENKKEMLK